MWENIQSFNQPIDISTWQKSDEFFVFPEGARDKNLFECPPSFPYSFCIPHHYYLIKYSPTRSPEQYWVEIAAYQLARAMNIPVPPAFVAYDSQKNISGALIQWFLKKPSSSPLEEIEEKTSGGDYFQQYISTYERKKGKQHNFETLVTICSHIDFLQDDWLAHWAKTLLFDAFIGNTDRHQDNWATITRHSYSDNSRKIFMAPAFDNGASMGYEIPNTQFTKFSDPSFLERYILRGKHRMKWSLNDSHNAGHGELLIKIAEKYPSTRSIMLQCLQISTSTIETILEYLTKFEVPVKLSPERASFMLQLLRFRKNWLSSILE